VGPIVRRSERRLREEKYPEGLGKRKVIKGTNFGLLLRLEYVSEEGRKGSIWSKKQTDRGEKTATLNASQLKEICHQVGALRKETKTRAEGRVLRKRTHEKNKRSLSSEARQCQVKRSVGTHKVVRKLEKGWANNETKALQKKRKNAGHAINEYKNLRQGEDSWDTFYKDRGKDSERRRENTNKKKSWQPKSSASRCP